MKETDELLWSLFSFNMDYCRHHEEQRAKATTVVIALAGAALAFVSHKDGINFGEWPIGLFLCLLGVYGGLVLMKHYERFKFHNLRALEFRRKLGKQLPDADIEEIMKQADARPSAKFPKLRNVRLHFRIYFGNHFTTRK